ncbi:condensation domain-containing protein [Streptomyces sp. B6B3]|uniref:condensation domain-containing protein n=1 Tax=Streptomyces sp. B6B3 TaxID=3153570 RepID=UPI00325EC088
MPVVQRRGPLGASQEGRWFVCALHPPMYYTIVLDVADDVTVEEMKLDLSVLLERHESLRTRFASDAFGTPYQEVLEFSGLDPFVVGTTEATSGTALMPRLAEKLAQTSAVVVLSVAGQRVTDAVICLHKAASDGYSTTIIRSELAEIFAARLEGRQARLPEIDWHPIDQATEELARSRSDRGRKVSEHWRQAVSSGPGVMVPFVYHPNGEEDDAVDTTMQDAEMERSCWEAAGASRVPVSSVFLAALLVVVASWTENDHTAVRSAFARRLSKKLARSVGHYSTDTEVYLDLDRSWTSAELLRQTYKATLRSYEMSEIRWSDLTATRARESASRGALVESSIHLNYRGDLSGPERRGRPAESGQRFEQRNSAGRIPIPFIDIEPDDTQCVVSFKAPAKLVSGGEAIRFLESYSRVAKAMAESPSTEVGELARMVHVARPWHRPGWGRHHGSWVNLNSLRHILEQPPAVATARAFVSNGDLIACVATTTDAWDVNDVRGHVRMRASWNAAVATPDRIIVCPKAPPCPEKLSSWLDRQSFTGDTRAPTPNPSDEREILLADAFLRFHPESTVDMSATYAELGGDFLKIPAILRYLTELGYAGLHWRDCAGLAPLRSLAANLRPGGEE